MHQGKEVQSEALTRSIVAVYGADQCSALGHKRSTALMGSTHADHSLGLPRPRSLAPLPLNKLLSIYYFSYWLAIIRAK